MHSTMHLYPIDGAVHDVGRGDTRLRYRDAEWAEVIVGVDPDPANADAIRDWCVGYWDATHPYSAGGAYVNFMMDEGQERVQATYRDNYDRLDEGQGGSTTRTTSSTSTRTSSPPPPSRCKTHHGALLREASSREASSSRRAADGLGSRQCAHAF